MTDLDAAIRERIKGLNEAQVREQIAGPIQDIYRTVMPGISGWDGLSERAKVVLIAALTGEGEIEQ